VAGHHCLVQHVSAAQGIGAVGVGRVFTYGGALVKPSTKNMESSMGIFEFKLLKLEASMKT
jgi:hypothetical protein